jgi:hypothetical protein
MVNPDAARHRSACDPISRHGSSTHGLRFAGMVHCTIDPRTTIAFNHIFVHPMRAGPRNDQGKNFVPWEGIAKRHL